MEKGIKKKSTSSDFFIPRGDFVISKVTPIWLSNTISRGVKYTRDQIKLLLVDPYKNYRKLQEVSNYLWATSPIYQNILLYMANIMTFDYSVIPDNTSVNKTTLESRLYTAAKIVKQMQVKENFPVIMARMLLQGEIFTYELSDNSNTIFKELPNTICELAFIDDDNLWRYYIDLSRITAGMYYELPEEIQQAYVNWVNGGKSKEKVDKLVDDIFITIPNNYYVVSKNGRVLMCHLNNKPHDYPYFASMFPDLITLEDDKEYFNEFIKQANLKLIHLKIPTDSDGIPLLDKDTIQLYHDSAKNSVPSNNAVLTNPFETEAISTDKSQTTIQNVVENSEKIVKSDSGISSTLFEASTTNGLMYSVLTDATKMYPLLYYFNNIVSYKTKNTKFKVQFLKINIFNKKDMHAQAVSDLAVGGSRLYFISTSELELFDYLMQAKLEKEIGIESLFAPKMSANQMSGNDVGAPELPQDQKADSTVVVDGYK